MTQEAISQIVAVLAGGLIAIAGGFLTTVMVDNRRYAREAHSLALAFKGEIRALIDHIHERDYPTRIEQIITQIEATREPFYMPMRIRFQYDRVYDANVERLGTLGGDLPELIPFFYTRFSAIMEDLINIGEGAYASLDLSTLVRIYRDVQRIMLSTVDLGERIEQEIERYYPPTARKP